MLVPVRTYYATSLYVLRYGVTPFLAHHLFWWDATDGIMIASEYFYFAKRQTMPRIGRRRKCCGGWGASAAQTIALSSYGVALVRSLNIIVATTAWWRLPGILRSISLRSVGYSCVSLTAVFSPNLNECLVQCVVVSLCVWHAK